MTVRPCARSPRRPAGPGSPRRRTGRNRRRATGWGPGAEWRRPGSRDRRGSSLYAWDMVPPDSLIRLWVKSCHRIYALYYVLYITAKAIQWQRCVESPMYGDHSAHAWRGASEYSAVDNVRYMRYSGHLPSTGAGVTGARNPGRNAMTAIALAAAPNKSPKSRRPPGPPDPPSLKGRIAAQLTGLAAEAECAELAEGAGDPEISADTVRQFMAHQLAAGHGLAMGLTGRARRLVRECAAESGGDEPTSRRSLELLRFVAGTARMMERCRAAAIALDRIGYPARPEGPDDGGPHRCDHPHHYAWRLSNERIAERRRVLDWLGQGKEPSAMPGVDDWPPYHNPDPDIEKLDERLATAPRRATPDPKRGRRKNGHPVGDYMKAPRCGAKTRRNGCCRQPAMSNGRCRL